MPFFAILLALLAAGVLYQRAGAARHRQLLAPPGVLIAVNGHRLHASCGGRGSPVVLFESGIGASSLSWASVAPAVAIFTRACAYDRAGLAWSDVPSCARTFDRIVDDLAKLLAQLASGEKCVLVGHSFGCFVVRAYAMRHPEQVVGIVLVDPAMEWLRRTPRSARLLRGGRQLSRVGILLAHVGVVRACLTLLTGGAPGAPRHFVKIFGPTAARTLERLVGEVRKLPPEVHPVVQALWCQPKCFRALGDYLQTLERDAAVIGAIAPPRNIPVVVISSPAQPEEQIEEHRRLARESDDGRHVLATRAGHWVQFDEPELIIDAIKHLVTVARSSDARELDGSPAAE